MAAPEPSGSGLLSTEDVDAVSSHNYFDIVFKWVNGFEPRPFKRADFGVKNRAVRKGISCDLLYQPGVVYLRQKAQGKSKDGVEDILWSQAYERLEQLLRNADTEAKCISKVFKRDNVTETEMTAVLAVHLFGILVPGGSLTINKNMKNLKHLNEECPCGCGRHFQEGDTGIGAAFGWHGYSDMIALPVTVTVLSQSVNEEESDPPTCKVPRWNEDYAGGVAIEMKQDVMKDQAGIVASQVTAKTIASSFAQAVKNPSLCKKFLPSVCCSTAGIMIYAYNVEEDIFISNVEELPVLNPLSAETEKFNIPAVLAVWLALNVHLTGSPSNKLALALDNSQFQELEGGIARSVYEKAEFSISSFDDATERQLGTQFFCHSLFKVNDCLTSNLT